MLLYMRELELKFCIANEISFIHQLEKKGIVLSDPVTQADMIFFEKTRHSRT